MTFSDLLSKNKVFLYYGNLTHNNPQLYLDYCYGVSLTLNDKKHIPHDIRNKFDLPDNSIDIIQAEDVFEHIEYSKILNVLSETYRILKPKGQFRLSVPDYNCDILKSRSQYEENEIVFDPGGGGNYVNGKVVNGGHLWFPTLSNIIPLLDASKFQYTIKQGWTSDTEFILEELDHTIFHVQRCPQHDARVQDPVRPLSIIIDLYKTKNT